jgi:predicted amidohydrolase
MYDVYACQPCSDRFRLGFRLQLVDVFVLPELCPLGYGADTFSRFIPKNQLIKDMLILIDEAFAMRAQRLNVYICYGTIGWKDEDGREVYTIRQKVVDRTGNLAAVYDKMFLRDSDAVAESEYFVPGPPAPVSFQVDQFSLGLMICSDLRYPHLARSLARDHRVDAILNPSSYVRDRSFRAWKTFREARALENSVYVVGVNYAGEKFGQSSITPPWIDSEHEPDDLGFEDGFLIGKVERSILDLVRTSMPFHRQLTTELPKA